MYYKNETFFLSAKKNETFVISIGYA